MKRTKMKRPMSSLLAVLFLVLVAALAAPQAQADVYLTSGSSQVVIDPTSEAGMHSWTVNGTEQMYQQWFWYRVGSTGGESSIDTLSAPVVVTSGTDRVDLTYTGNLMSVLVRYTLTGGSTSAAVAETIKVTNTSASSLALHFFRYSDFDINGTWDMDTAQIYGRRHNRVIQSDGTVAVAEVVTPRPSHYQVSFYPSLILSLTDGDPTTLSDTGGPLGPEDLDWAYQWDVDLASGASFLIRSKDKLVGAVPIPPAAILFGTGLLGLVGIGLKRRS